MKKIGEFKKYRDISHKYRRGFQIEEIIGYCTKYRSSEMAALRV